MPAQHVGRLGLRFDRSAYESGKGLVVREVVPLGPAAIEGIVDGDHLLAVNGQAIAARTNLNALLTTRSDDAPFCMWRQKTARSATWW